MGGGALHRGQLVAMAVTYWARKTGHMLGIFEMGIVTA